MDLHLRGFKNLGLVKFDFQHEVKASLHLNETSNMSFYLPTVNIPHWLLHSTFNITIFGCFVKSSLEQRWFNAKNHGSWWHWPLARWSLWSWWLWQTQLGEIQWPLSWECWRRFVDLFFRNFPSECPMQKHPKNTWSPETLGCFFYT